MSSLFCLQEMEEILKQFIRPAHPEMNRQIQFIIKQLNSSKYSVNRFLFKTIIFPAVADYRSLYCREHLSCEFSTSFFQPFNFFFFYSYTIIQFCLLFLQIEH